MFRKFKYGERLVVQLSNTELIYGDFVKGTANRLDMKNLTDQEKKPINGVMSFYSNEVASVKVWHKKGTKDPPSPELHATSIPSDNRDIDEILIEEAEYERLKQMAQDFIFVHQKDNVYYQACKDLQASESLGIVGLGCRAGRDSKLHLLVVSTWQNVYIFDVAGSFNISLQNELKDILESDYIQKVVHDGRALVDCLYYVHKIHINNIFDTLIADVTLKKRSNAEYDNKLNNISECLIEAFNFPEYLLYGAVKVDDNEWKSRPLEPELKIKAAQLGTYLLTLKDYLQKKLLEDYYNNIKSVYRMVTTHDSIRFNHCMNSNVLTPELNAVIK